MRHPSGEPKQLLTFHGEPLLRTAAQAAIDASCDPVILVLGAHAERILPLLQGLPVRIANNPQWAAGMGASIHVGLAEVLQHAPNVAALLIVLCDQPLVSAGDLQELIRMHRESGKSLVAAFYAETVGPPVLIGRDHFPDLAALPEGVGAKALLTRFPAELATVPMPHAAVDVDTPTDYARLLGERR